MTSGDMHDASIPRLSDNRAFIVIPHEDFKEGAVACLIEIGMKGFLLADRGALVVKDEATLSENALWHVLETMGLNSFVKLTSTLSG